MRKNLAKLFNVDNQDKVVIDDVRPLQPESEWAIFSLVCPTVINAYAGIASQRSGFVKGKNLFTLWLKDGYITIESDADSKKTNIRLPLNRWSHVGATCLRDEARVFMGGGGQLEEEIRLPILTGAHGDWGNLTIGHLGASFPGAIAFVFIFSGGVSHENMREWCNGNYSLSDLAKAKFRWIASEEASSDLCFGKSMMIKGLRSVIVPDGLMCLDFGKLSTHSDAIDLDSKDNSNIKNATILGEVKSMPSVRRHDFGWIKRFLR